jgi:hypothetical protein
MHEYEVEEMQYIDRADIADEEHNDYAYPA